VGRAVSGRHGAIPARIAASPTVGIAIKSTAILILRGDVASLDGRPPTRTLGGMIILTESAAKQVGLLARDANPDSVLRVFVEQGGCSGFEYGMSFDERKPDDTLFESEGVKLVVDPTSLVYLDGSTIHFDDGLHGKGFEVKNPNAASTCGCGKSFS